ncbi:MAG: Hsp20/alpha crystallin family protein [Saprospiraceae bacterium]
MNTPEHNFLPPQLPNSNGGYISKNYLATPAVNIIDCVTSFEIDLAAPGLKQSDFQLKLAKNVLTVQVNVPPKKADNRGFVRREFGFTNFERHFQLPITTQLDSIKATYEQGVLHLHIPKAPKKRLLHFSQN